MRVAAIVVRGNRVLMVASGSDQRVYSLPMAQMRPGEAPERTAERGVSELAHVKVTATGAWGPGWVETEGNTTLLVNCAWDSLDGHPTPQGPCSWVGWTPPFGALDLDLDPVTSTVMRSPLLRF